MSNADNYLWPYMFVRGNDIRPEFDLQRAREALLHAQWWLEVARLNNRGRTHIHYQELIVCRHLDNVWFHQERLRKYDEKHPPFRVDRPGA